jgi:hypothetical protein
MMILK